MDEDHGRPMPAVENADTGDFAGTPILYLTGWCGVCAATLRAHLGLEARPCPCGAALAEIVDGGRRWRRAGAVSDLTAVLGRRPEEAPRDGSPVVAWIAGVHRVADSRWDGMRWKMRGSDGWERVDGDLVAWLPCSLDATIEEVP